MKKSRQKIEKFCFLVLLTRKLTSQLSFFAIEVVKSLTTLNLFIFLIKKLDHSKNFSFGNQSRTTRLMRERCGAACGMPNRDLRYAVFQLCFIGERVILQGIFSLLAITNCNATTTLVLLNEPNQRGIMVNGQDNPEHYN